MENPSQSTYAPEELFTLKPDIIEKSIAKTEMPVATILENPATIAPIRSLNKPKFWSKYKWFIIGGVVLIGGVSFFIYRTNQKKKKNWYKN